MKRRVLGGRFVLTVVGFLTLAFFLSTGNAQAQDSDAREVTLTLTTSSSGKCKITVDPDPAHIWRGPNEKIKKVKWVAAPDPEHRELYWELRYKGNSPVASGNYFGAVDLPCGVTHVKKQPATPGKAKAAWPYSVTVYLCENGVKKTRLCRKDPRIQWND